MGLVKSHTRKTKSGKIFNVKSFTRKHNGTGRLGTSSKYGKEFQQHVHNQFLSNDQIKRGKENGFVSGYKDNVFNYDSVAKDFYVTPGMREKSLTKGLKTDAKGRSYLKKNRREVLNNLFTWDTPTNGT